MYTENAEKKVRIVSKSEFWVYILHLWLIFSRLQKTKFELRDIKSESWEESRN